MASLSNINGLFDVHSTGAILFSNTHGTSGQILRSNGNAAPTWVAASTVIGGPYLPLTGGTLTGPLSGTSATFSGIIYSSGGFRTGSTNSSYNLLTRNNNNGSYPLYCQNSLGVFGDAAIARFAYGSYGANTGTAVLDVRSGTSYFNDCNLGIGTASPYKKLEVVGDLQLDASNASMWIKSGATGTSGFINWTFNSDDTVYNKIGIDYDTRASTGFHIDTGYPLTLDCTNYIDFKRSGGTLGRWNSTGLGIGTDSPSRKLTIDGTTSTAINIKSNTTDGLSFLALGDADDDNYAQIILDNATNKLQIQNGGGSGITNRGITLDSSENVGIGTATPGYKLQVQGTGYYSGQLTVDGFTNNSGISFRTGIAITNVGIRAKAVGTTNRDGLELLGYNGIDFTVNNGANVAMRIVGVTGSGMGNVGIGTTSPSGKLHVSTGTDTSVGNIEFFIGGTNAGNARSGKIIKNTTSPYEMTIRASNFTNGNNLILNDTGGNVGIGTTSPAASAKLTIMGNQTFGLPGNGTNTSGRFISIEGNTDSSGEGSSRIFFTEHNSSTAAMDKYGMSLGYRGGATSIVGASGNTWTGLTQIGNGQWGMWGHNNSATGSLIMSGDRAATYVSIPGKVGIGTSSPGSKLEVNVVDDGFGDIDVLRLKRTWATGSGTDRAHGILFNDSNSRMATIYADRTNSGANYNSDLLFATNTGTSGTSLSTKMVIKADGNVGIGTTTPYNRLHSSGVLGIGTANQTPGLTSTMSGGGGGAQFAGGSIYVIQGYAGVMSSGDTFTFIYEATDWKAWSAEFVFTSTSGMSRGAEGGYNNNGSGHSSEMGTNALGCTASTTNVGQHVKIVFSFTNPGTHPMAKITYSQSGGDGVPRADRVNINWNT